MNVENRRRAAGPTGSSLPAEGEAPSASSAPRKQPRLGSPPRTAAPSRSDHASRLESQTHAAAEQATDHATAAPAARAPAGADLRLPETADLQLAGYLLARECIGRPVESSTRALLARANDTRKETLAMMRYGRGNVRADLEQTDYAGFHRMLAYRHAIGSVSSLGEAPQVSQARDAAMSAYVGSGNCGEFANVAAHIHAGRLQHGERLIVQKSGSVDHSWVVVQGTPAQGENAPSALIDAWGEGPVMEAGDSRFVASAPSSPLTIHTIEASEADAVHRDFNRLKADPGTKTTRRLELLITSNERAGRRPADALYDPIAIASSRLARSAREALDARSGDASLTDRAISLAREIAPVEPVAETQVARAVLTFACDLSATAPRALEKRQSTSGVPGVDDA